MDDLLSEKERIEQIRSWWSEYRYYVIGGIVIGAGLLFGSNQYQANKLQAQLDASTAYEKLIEYVVSGDLENAETIANEIETQYSGTTYVGQAGLALARLYMDQNRDQDAADALLSVVNGKSGDELKHVARLRLARVYLYQDKAEEVVALLADLDKGAFAAAYSEVLGDAYTALGRIAEAEDEYQKVLMDPLSRGTVDPQLVQWKALDLPEVQAEAPTDAAEPEAVAPVENSDTDVE
ncbi:MAG: tetratricopeptide repeat protein, partial [Gammaproteobacteria bacterium]|nr:tetratricopeptide repeat protein [Gammaproteobacteria bacterium]